MGMTIDDNVDFLNEAKDFFEDVVNNPNIKETIKAYFIIESLETAIDTMRKYQKITEIVEHYRENVRDKVTNENMEKILEVVEDEKID